MHKRLFISRVSDRFTSDASTAQSTPQFHGLGTIGNIVVPPHSVVLSTEKDEILALPGITGSQNYKSQSTDTHAILEIAQFVGEQVSRNAQSVQYRSPSAKMYAGTLQPYEWKRALITFMSHVQEYDPRVVELCDIDTLSDTPLTFLCDMQWICDRISSTLSEDIKAMVREKVAEIGVLSEGIFTPFPHMRHIQSPYDIFQEIVRFLPFSDIEDKPIQGMIHNPDQSQLYHIIYSLKSFIVSLGFTEVMTRPFVSEDMLVEPQFAIRVINPNSELQPYLSDSLIPRLLNVYADNSNQTNVALFECGRVFTKNFEHNIVEKTRITLLFETDNPYLASSYVHECIHKVFHATYAVSPAQVSYFGSTVTYTDNETAQSIYLTQISKKVLKQHDIALSKRLWALEYDISSDTHINVYRTYIDENKFDTVTRTVNVSLSTHDARYWCHHLTKHNAWVIQSEMQSIFQKEGDEILSIHLTFNDPSQPINSREVDAFIETVLHNS